MICLTKGENIILKAQGTLQYRASIHIGHLLLTDRRLIFSAGAKQIVEISLDKIIEISITKRIWLLGVLVKHLCITFYQNEEQERIYIALAQPEKWKTLIKDRIILLLAERWNYSGANPEPTSDT